MMNSDLSEISAAQPQIDIRRELQLEDAGVVLDDEDGQYYYDAMENEDEYADDDDDDDGAVEGEEVGEDDDEQGVAMTPLELIAHFRQAFDQRLSQLGREKGFMFTMFYTSDLVAMTLNPALRSTFTKTFAERKLTELFFEFDDLVRILNFLSGYLTVADVLACMREISQDLGRIQTLSHLNIGEGAASVIPVAAILIAACRQIRLLVIGFGDSDDGHMEALCQSLHSHPVSSELRLCRPNMTHMRSLCPVIHTMPNLKSFSLLGADADDTEYESLLVDEPADAALLQDVFAIKSLDELYLRSLECESVQAATVLCNGLASSQIKSLQLSTVKLPDAMEASLVQAVTTAPLVELAFSVGSTRLDEYLLLCHGLKASTTLKKLTLGEWCSDDDEFDSDDLVVLLKDYKEWNLGELELSVKHWSDSFQKLICDYVQTKDLRRLILNFPEKFDGPPSAPSDLITAVDSGTRSLEEINVVQAFKGDITSTWCAKMTPMLELNRERRIHGPLFSAVQSAENPLDRKLCLQRALDAVDMNTFFRFVRRNEWHLQEIIKEAAHEGN